MAKKVPKTSKKTFKKKAAKKKAPKKMAKKIPCIAARCKNASTGPRFHYLCKKHREAKKAQIRAWQAATVVDRGSGTVSKAA